MQIKKSDWERKEMAREKLDRKNAKHNAKEQKRCHREWRTCFAWLPKKMMNGRVLWLERIRKRRHPGHWTNWDTSYVEGSVDYKESIKRIQREDAAEAMERIHAEIALEGSL